MLRKELPSLVISKGGGDCLKPKVVTEADYVSNPLVGLHYSPFNYSAVSYDVLGNVMYENANHNQVMHDHDQKMKEVHRSEPVENDISKALREIGVSTVETLEKSSKKKVAEIAEDEAEEAVDEHEDKMHKKSAVVFALDDIIKGGAGSGPHRDMSAPTKRPLTAKVGQPKSKDSFKEAQDMVQKERTSVLLNAYKRKSIDETLDDLIKSGEGTRGGK